MPSYSNDYFLFNSDINLTSFAIRMVDGKVVYSHYSVGEPSVTIYDSVKEFIMDFNWSLEDLNSIIDNEELQLVIKKNHCAAELAIVQIYESNGNGNYSQTVELIDRYFDRLSTFIHAYIRTYPGDPDTLLGLIVRCEEAKEKLNDISDNQ